MDDEQGEADAAEETAIRRMRVLRNMRTDRWVKRLVGLALVGYLSFYMVASAAPRDHLRAECLAVPTVVHANC